MTLLTNTAEGGAADGTVVDTAASANPNAFTTVLGSEITYQSGAAYKGARGFRHAASASVSSYFGWTGVAGASTDAAFRFYLRFSTLPAVDQQLAKTLSSGGGTGLVFILLTPAGLIKVGSDPNTTTYGSSTGALEVDTWYRVEVGVTNPSTTTGTATVRVYLGETNTVVSTADFTAVNNGTSAQGTIRFGRGNANASAWTFDLDDVAFRTGSAALIGPSTVPPTADAGADQVGIEPWATVALSGTDTGAQTAITGRAWTQSGGPAVTLSGASTATATLTAPGTVAGATLTFTYTVTDAVGLTAADTTTVTVLPVTERAVIGGVEVPMQLRTS